MGTRKYIPSAFSLFDRASGGRQRPVLSLQTAGCLLSHWLLTAHHRGVGWKGGPRGPATDPQSLFVGPWILHFNKLLSSATPQLSVSAGDTERFQRCAPPHLPRQAQSGPSLGGAGAPTREGHQGGCRWPPIAPCLLGHGSLTTAGPVNLLWCLNQRRKMCVYFCSIKITLGTVAISLP